MPPATRPGFLVETWRANDHGRGRRRSVAQAVLAEAGGEGSARRVDVDVLSIGGVDEGLDVLDVGRDDRDRTTTAESLGDRDEQSVNTGDLVAGLSDLFRVGLVEGVLGDVAQLAGTVVGLDGPGDVDLNAGATEPVDHPVDESVVFGLARTGLAHHRAGDVQRADDLPVHELPVGIEQFLVAGQAGNRSAIEQEVAAFPGGHADAEDQVAALARSFSYSAVLSTPWASSSSPTSLKRACCASTSRRSASSMKTSGEKPLLEAPLLDASMSSSFGIAGIVAPRMGPGTTSACSRAFPTSAHDGRRPRPMAAGGERRWPRSCLSPIGIEGCRWGHFGRRIADPWLCSSCLRVQPLRGLCSSGPKAKVGGSGGGGAKAQAEEAQAGGQRQRAVGRTWGEPRTRAKPGEPESSGRAAGCVDR